MSDQIVDDIVAGLEDDGVYIAPDLERSVSREQLETLQTAVQDAREPIFVVMVDAIDADAFGGSVHEMLSQVHDTTNEPGTYVSAIGFGTATVGTVVTESWEVTPMADKVSTAAELQHPSDAIAQVVATADFYAHGIPQRLEGRQPTYSIETTPSSDPDEGGIAWGPVGLGAALLAGVVALVLLRRRSKATGSQQRALTLPGSIVARASSQSRARHRATAEQELVALGQLIDDTDVRPEHDPAAWQAAIDRYDAGTRLIDQSDPPADGRSARGNSSDRDASGAGLLDVIGAIVLARQGCEALADAIAGTAFTPQRHCYLHPLHSGRTEDAQIESEGRRVSVPLCGTCRDDLHRGRVPDALDVMVDGTPRHYFDSGISPWAETAYGAQGDDLIAALHAR